VCDAGFDLRLLACEAWSVTLRLFVNLRYRAVITRVARTATFSNVNHHAHERRNFVENCLEFIAQFLSTTKNEVGKVLIARPLFRTREILFDGSSAIPAAAIEIDVERLRKRAQPSPIAVRRITLDKFSRGW